MTLISCLSQIKCLILNIVTNHSDQVYIMYVIFSCVSFFHYQQTLHFQIILIQQIIQNHHKIQG